MSLNAQLTLRLVGTAALAALMLLLAAVFAYSTLPIWLITLALVFLIIPPAYLVCTAGFRLMHGGNTDIEIKDGKGGSLQIANARFSDIAQALAHAKRWNQPVPMARPVGVVIGNPSNVKALHEDRHALLPSEIDVTESPQEVPPGAAGIAGIKEATGTASGTSSAIGVSGG